MQILKIATAGSLKVVIKLVSMKAQAGIAENTTHPAPIVLTFSLQALILGIN